METEDENDLGELVDEIAVKWSDDGFIVESAAVGVTGQGPTIEKALNDLVETVEETVPKEFDEVLEPADAP